jgi:hypothetical protein
VPVFCLAAFAYYVGVGIYRRRGWEEERIEEVSQMEAKDKYSRLIKAAIALALSLCLMLGACGGDKGKEAEHLAVPDSADNYVGQNYQQVQKELENAGFTNVEAVAVDGDNADGAVKLITIDGDDEFTKGSRHTEDAEIIITYIAYKEDDVPAPVEPSPSVTPTLIKYFPGDIKTTNEGYSDGEAVGEKDPHYGWALGRFYINNFSRVIDEKAGNPIVLKTPGDEITLGFKLDQDIDKLNGNEKLSIADDEKGSDAYFESTEKSAFGRGALFVRRTDYQGNVDKTMYTDYLPAKTVGANTVINTYEEGDYEVALDYKIKNDGFLFFDPETNYQLLFKFSVRNGSCMVYPRDIKTTSELPNGSIAPSGFFIDLTKSRYLKVDVKREILVRGKLDIHYNRPAKDDEEYDEEGIYTITASNEYTGEHIEKKICVGANSTLVEYFEQHQ